MNFINSHPPLLFTTTKCWNLISIAPFFSSVQVKFKIHHPHHEHPTKDRNFLSLFWITAQKVVTPLLLLINNFNCLRETICMSLVITLSFPPTHHRIQIKSAPWHLSITPHKICSSHSFVFSSLLSTTFVLVHFMNSAQFPPAETPVNYSVWKESHPSPRARCLYYSKYAAWKFINHEAILPSCGKAQKIWRITARKDVPSMLSCSRQSRTDPMQTISTLALSCPTMFHSHLAPLTIIRPLNNINV